MLRSIQFLTLLSVLTVTTLSPLTSRVQPVSAQSDPIACNPNEHLEAKASTLEVQARNALDRSDIEKVLVHLQEATTIAIQFKNASIQSNLIQVWLLEPYGISLTSRLIHLNQQLNSPQKSLVLLNQFRTLIEQIPSTNNYEITRAYVAIARQYAALNQSQTALMLLSRSRQLESTIKAPHERAIALIEIAEGFAELSQTQAVQTTLIQVERTIPQIQAEEWTRLDVQKRTAILYARIGKDAKSQQILQQLRNFPDSYAPAQSGIVDVYIQNRKLVDAEKLAQAIARPQPKLFALTKIAIAYQNNPSKSNQLFRQALTFARSHSDVSLKDSLLQTLVIAHLQVGQLEQALQITRSLKFPHSPTLRAVIEAYYKAGKSTQARQLLSQELAAIKAVSNTWEQRIRLSDLIRTAVAIEQFDWIRQEWATISTIDNGLQDWQVIQIATTYAKTGKYAQAANWVRQLPLNNRPATDIKALSAIALVAHHRGNTNFANQLLEQALRSTEAMDKVIGNDPSSLSHFKSIALASIAVVYSQMQQPEKMRQILQQVVAFSEKIDDPTIAIPIDHPFTQFSEAQQFVGALQIAEGTAFPDVKQSRLQTSALGLLTINRLDLALPIVDRITSPNGKTQLLLAIAQRYAELNQAQKALPILAQAFQVAQTILGDESEFDRLGTDGSTVIPIDADRGSLTEAIAVQYARLNQMTEALKVANTLKEQSTREEALQKVRCAGRA